MKDHIQPGILLDVPAHSGYLSFSILPDGDLPAAMKALAADSDGFVWDYKLMPLPAMPSLACPMLIIYKHKGDNRSSILNRDNIRLSLTSRHG